MPKDYSKFVIKDYKYWELTIHENQGYLGRSVIWCKRPDALDLADATSEEQAELFTIVKELGPAYREVFHPDWLNYAFLGNETRHLHGHFIPRYATEKVFMGVTFKDGLYGHNYKTDHAVTIPEEVFWGIHAALKKALNK